MWELFFKVFLLFFLTACGRQEPEIVPADDLNRFYQGSGKRIFAVKEHWFQTAQCSDFEQWAKANLPQEHGYDYYFVIYHNDITLKNNPYLKSEYDILTNEYLACMMSSDKRECYYCKGKN